MDDEDVHDAISDPQAFARIYDRYFDAVHRYSQRRIVDPEEAADATAQIFVNALNGLVSGRYDPKRRNAGFRSWLFSIAHNVVTDVHRRRRRVVRLDFDQHGTTDETTRMRDLADPAPGPDELVLQAHAAHELHRALEQLPERHRSIVELRLAGLTPAEIAVVLDMSPGNVRITQYRAFALLRKHLFPLNATNEGDTL